MTLQAIEQTPTTEPGAYDALMEITRRPPITFTQGRGGWLWDSEGKRYLDFVQGWAVNCLGHCPPAVASVLVEQSTKLLNCSPAFYNEPMVRYAEELTAAAGLDRVFFANSGAEANEGAIKLARKYGKEKLNGAFEIIAADNSFHGRTLTTVAATGNPNYQVNFTPMTPGFIHVPFDDVEAIKGATTDQTCAVMLEPVQGEGGVNVPAPGYLKAVREWCDEKGLLLILDEVQTGMGRLGTIFGYELYGVEPDVMTLAKGMGGGVPIGAFLTKEHCNVLRPGDHGSTFGGNALTCAAAYAACNYIVEEGMAAKGKAMGERLQAALDAVKARHETSVKEVRGEGLLLAVEFHEAISGDVVGRCNEEGLLLNPVRPTAVRFMPPLNVSPAEVDEAVARFERGLTAAQPAA